MTTAGFIANTKLSPQDRHDMQPLEKLEIVSLLASMLEILVLALEILHEESSHIGLEINWSKTKLQAFDDTSTLLPTYLYSTMMLRLSIPLSTLDPA